MRVSVTPEQIRAAFEPVKDQPDFEESRALLEQGGRAAIGALLAAGLLSPLFGCRRAPGTARDQIIFISEEKEIALGVESFRELLKSAPIVTDPKITGLVTRVGQRIAAVANKPEYHWEFVVIREDSMINAFALPRGSQVRVCFSGPPRTRR